MTAAEAVATPEGLSDLPNVLALAFRPVDTLHPTWWREDWLPGALFERVRQDRSARRHLSRFFLRQAGADAAWDLAAEPPHVALALLDGPRLANLALFAGVTLHSGSIARVLRGGDRLRIREGIGADAYEFALRRGRFLLQQARLGENAAGTGLTDFDQAGETCRRTGVAALTTALRDAAPPLARRVQWKLPRDLVERDWQPLAEAPDAFLRLFRLLDRQAPGT